MWARVAVLAALWATPLAAAPEIERVTTRLFGRDEFVGLIEYFTGEEHPGSRTIVRSDATRREGYYFVLELDAPVADLPPGASVALEIIPADTGDVVRLALPVPPSARHGYVLMVGLTDARWAQSPSPLLAWRVALLDPSGAEISSEQSFLWEMP